MRAESTPGLPSVACPPPAPPPAPLSRPVTVLVVDDDASGRYVIARVLRGAGYRVLEAATGTDTLALVAAERPDLVVLDVRLPDTDGFEVCRLLKEQATTAAIPVLQFSAQFTKWEDQVRGLEGGADAYLTTPVEPAVLLSTARALLRARRAEQELRQANADLERRVQSRTDELLQAERLAAIGQTVAVMAHEGRNALQRAHTCLARLEARLVGRPEEAELAARVGQALGDLEQLFEDVRGYAAPVRLDRKPCDLAAVWREAWARLAARREARDARLKEEPGGADLTCEADPFRLGQVFLNLFTNALEACPDPVVLRVSCASADLAGRAALRVSIRDNGPGFAPEQRQHLFEPFRTTKSGGTGLGMAICRRLVEAHGGSIEAGDGGAGAEVIITLPQGPASG